MTQFNVVWCLLGGCSVCVCVVLDVFFIHLMDSISHLSSSLYVSNRYLMEFHLINFFKNIFTFCFRFVHSFSTNLRSRDYTLVCIRMHSSNFFLNLLIFVYFTGIF